MAAVLIAGTTSDAGKSVIVAGLCRALTRRGIRVAPFKAQNMSNNSAVCPDGGEIGRAQALQAAACGLEPSVDFNPILLKPGSDRTSQLVVRGRAEGQVSARSYIEHRTHLREVAAACLRDLESRFQLVVCEGAGSPAEINLRETDVANFGLAEACDLPVYVVGDIDRGGVLAHLFGTHQIVSEADQARIKGSRVFALSNRKLHDSSRYMRISAFAHTSTLARSLIQTVPPAVAVRRLRSDR